MVNCIDKYVNALMLWFVKIATDWRKALRFYATIIVWGAFVFLAGETLVYADAPFSSQRGIADDTPEARSVHVADIDRDGDLDAISASANNDTIAWHENTQGDGSKWTTRVIADTADCAMDVYAADIDADGDLDVLSASRDDDTIAWYRNNIGDGSCWTKIIITTAADGAWSVHSADVDGDGDLDVLSASRDDSTIAWFENTTGTGSAWIAHVVSTDAQSAYDVHSVDVDGDGDVDILSASGEDDTIAWFENTAGDGSAWVEHEITTQADDAWSVYAADIDADGDVDVLSASREDNKIAWYENVAGDGSNWAVSIVASDARGASSVHAADLDGDKDMDLLSASANDDRVVWYENTARDGTAWKTHTLSDGADYAVAVFAADLDGDGDRDVISASVDGNRIAWHENTTVHRNASYLESFDISISADNVQAVHCADLDGDGDEDLVSASADDNKIVWYANSTGDGVAWEVAEITDDATGACSVYSADVDRDGDLDVVSASAADDTIAWHENVDGDGSRWETFIITDTADGARSVFAADLDGDGDADLMSASSTDDRIVWYENRFGHVDSWVIHEITGAADEANSVFAADLDRDGDLDVLSASYSDDTIAWYENSAGDGTAWEIHTITTLANGIESIHAVDVDADGDTDVLSASKEDDTIAWYENRAGDGSAWTTHKVSTTVPGAINVSAADLDNDGDQDLMVVSVDDRRFAWYENTDGDGSAWTLRSLSNSALGAAALVAADLDGDGDLDLIGAVSGEDRIAGYINNGGQYRIATTNLASDTILINEVEAILKIDATHLGRPDDTAWQLTRLELLFEEYQGKALTSSEANALVESLFIYQDDGSGELEFGQDVRVTLIESLELDSGRQILEFTAQDPKMRLVQGSPKTYLVVVKLTTDSPSQPINRFRVSHVLPTVAMVRYRDYDLAGIPESVQLGSTPVMDPAYTITADTGPNGAVTPSGETVVAHGGTQEYAIQANHGFCIFDVTVDGKSVGAVSSYTFEEVNASHSISASFVSAGTIQAQSGINGHLEPEGLVTVCHGIAQTFTITPDEGYCITDVKVDGVSMGSIESYTFTTVFNARGIEASFGTPLTIFASAGMNGSIEPSGEIGTCTGSDQTFTIVPEKGYGIADVLVDGVSIGIVEQYTFSDLQEDRTIEARFTTASIITASAGKNGSISPSGEVIVSTGMDQVFSMIPDRGSDISDVLVDGQSVGAVNSYTFTNVTADHTITVSFTDPPPVEEQSAGSGGCFVDCVIFKMRN
jgi:hypothetical protein